MVDVDAFFNASLGVFMLDETLSMATAHFTRTIALRKLDALTDISRSMLGIDSAVAHVDHVVFSPRDGKMRFECLRCGEVYPATMPIPVRVMSAIVDAFHQDHAHCEEKP